MSSDSRDENGLSLIASTVLNSTRLSAREQARTQRNREKIRKGTYKIGAESFLKRHYVYIPSSYLEGPNFSFSSVFSALGIEHPSIIFRVIQTNDPSHWNTKLPHDKESLAENIEQAKKLNVDEEEKGESNLKNAEHRGRRMSRQLGSLGSFGKSPVKEETHRKGLFSMLLSKNEVYDGDVMGPVRHHQGVLRENCRRLLRGAGQACNQAGGIFQINESWASDTQSDAVAEWITGKSGDAVTTLGLASSSDYHASIWDRLDEGAIADFNEEEGGVEADPVLIDPLPFQEGEIAVSRDLVTGRVKGSFPHPKMTHLIVSDNLQLLEKKMAEAVPSGLLMINGSPRAADIFTEAILEGKPVILFKYTGGTTDIACEMLEKVDDFLEEKRFNEYARPIRPFRDDIDVGHYHSGWLQPFDEKHISDCEKVNILIENWPDSYKHESVLIVDMFRMTEDELQDRLTQTMGVAFGGGYELGGANAERKRLTYAWRMRHMYSHNGDLFKSQSDFWTMVLILVTMLSTFSAVCYTYLEIHSNFLGAYHDMATDCSLKANLLLPLVATIVRGYISVASPLVKYNALEEAGSSLESEIYQYRTKTGKYSSFRIPKKKSDETADNPTPDNGPNKAQEPRARLPARAVFAISMDRIWNDLKSSDIQNGALVVPRDTSQALAAVNARIRQNRSLQNAYLQPLQQHKDKPSHIDIKANITSLGIDIESKTLGIDTIKDHDSSTGCCPIWCNKEETIARGADYLKIPIDNGLEELSAEEYVQYRLLPVAAEMAKKTPGMSYSSYSNTIMIIFISISASALSTFGYSVFIPAALAVSGGLTAWSSYRQTDMRLLQTNSSLSQLNQLLIWWDGLTMIERRVPKNKDTLVQLSEAAILAQTIVYSSSKKSSSSLSDDAERASS